MNDLARPSSPVAASPAVASPVVPRSPLTVRPAAAGDLPFIDELQKRHTRMVGWMPTAQLQGKIAAGHVLVAEEGSGVRVQGSGTAEDASIAVSSSSLNPEPRTLSPLGYAIGHDQYFKRDDVGIIYQVNVAPAAQRGLVGAALVKAMFDRAAYGCRLFCCWCAQDIEANRFWESLGFVPLAFRAGSREKGRVHIFWQRRVRAGDATTPYWFPSQTSSGSIREDRLVFPIPPGVHWRDAMPIVLPGAADGGGPGQLPAPRQRRKPKAAPVAEPPGCIAAGGLRLAVAAKPPEPEPGPKAKTPRVKVKNDPRLVAAARELRDRWLERVNAPGAAGGAAGGAAALVASGKYDVSKVLAAPSAIAPLPLPAPVAA